MTSIMYSVSDLQRAYLTGNRKTGVADTASIGIACEGRPITKVVFRRYDVVEYWHGVDHFATFQDRAALDD